MQAEKASTDAESQTRKLQRELANKIDSLNERDLSESIKHDKSKAYNDSKTQELNEQTNKFEKFCKDKFGQIKL